METELKLENCDLELDGAEGGCVWVFGHDDQWNSVKCSEIPKVIAYLSQFVKVEKEKSNNEN
ncbi:MAG: hypothetical protein ACTSWK_17645 [Promethearchaeota archaeon]